MAHLNSKTIQEFAVKIPKQSIFRASRKSICPTNIDDTGTSPNLKERLPRPSDQRGTACSMQPLMDLSNQEVRNADSANLPTQHVLRYQSKDSITSQTMGRLHTDANKIKIPSLKKTGLNTMKRNPLSSISGIVSRRTYMGPLKENSRKSPFSRRGDHHPPANRRVEEATNGLPFALPPSRLTDPESGSVFKKIKPRRYSVAVTGLDRRIPLLSCKKNPLVSHSSRRKGVLASVQKETTGNDRLYFNRVALKQELPQKSSNWDKQTTQDRKEECRRALQFHECLEERDEETTKPLPIVDLAILEQPTEGGSILHSQLPADPSGTKERQSEGPWDTVTKGRTFLVDAFTSVRPRPALRPNRSIGIPVLKRISPSSLQGGWISPRLGLTAASSGRRGTAQETRVGGTSQNIPKIKVTRPSITSPSCLNGKPLNISKALEDGRPREAGVSSVTKTSPSAPPNSPHTTRKSWVAGNHHGNDDDLPEDERGKVQCCNGDVAMVTKERSVTDASTNTILSSAHFHAPFAQVEGQIEAVLQRQQAVLDAFEASLQEMKAEFARKSKLLLEEWHATAKPLEDIKKDLLETVTNTVATLQVKENAAVEDPAKEEEAEYKHTKLPHLKFLDTPLPVKNKRRLKQCFSHPPSPGTFIATSPRSREESFHSMESLSMSPFTNFVGDCERASLVPMTPTTRLNVTGLKSSLNNQLNSLFG